MNNILSLISLCKRAAKLVLGFDRVKESILNYQAQGVYLTKDLSSKTKKEVEFLCTREQIPLEYLPYTMEEIKHAVGKASGVLAITDKGLANKLNQQIKAANAAAAQGQPENQ